MSSAGFTISVPRTVATKTHALALLHSNAMVLFAYTVFMQRRGNLVTHNAADDPAPVVTRLLTEKDAIDIWIARWLRVRQKDLLVRYRCDSRRLYEVWWGERFPASRDKAMQQFRAVHPNLADRTVFGYRRIPRSSPNQHQADLFE